MNSSETQENLVFDYHTIRLLIGLIALTLPLVVSIRAAMITDSISWSYHTDARDFFVGLLFVIGAFLMSYKGHKPVLDASNVGKFWTWLSKFWKGAISFRIWERKYEEDFVSWIGGIAAWVTAANPTSKCIGEGCPPDLTSSIHYAGAIFLFSTTVYFCLVAFKDQVSIKIKNSPRASGKGKLSPKELRLGFYTFCGWGIAVIMLGLIVVKSRHIINVSNLTFWVETAALVLFGTAWMVASQYLPVVTDETDRQKLFFEPKDSE
jgi:hypothetical protein